MRTLLLGLIMLLPATARAETLNLYAAGSLRAGLSEVARAFEQRSGGALTVQTTFGASGLLRERIEAGEAAHVFASADTGHPRRLSELGRTAGPVRVFARNALCALVRGGLTVTPDTLLDVMLDPGVRVGTSTPKADPSGDYAFAAFAKADAVKAGARDRLEAKALQLSGGPTSPKAPEGRSLYAWLMSEGKADLYLTYCTNAVQAKAEVPSLQIVAMPEALRVGADYGLVVLMTAPKPAHELADFIRSEEGQAILTRYGFGKGD